MANSNNNKNHAKQVALAGVFTALALLIMLAGGFMPITTFSAPILASLCLVPLLIEMGTKIALLAFLAVSLLSLLLVPDKELVLFFVLLIGYYPVLQPQINKLKLKWLRVLIKLIIFNLAVLVIYALLLFLFTSPALRAEFAENSLWFWGILLVVGNFTFMLYDILINKIRFLYIHKFRKILFR